MNTLQRINTTIAVVIMTVSCGALLAFGWSGSGWKVLSIPTGSMRPTIPSGSLVFVHRVPASSLKIGDIITYIDPLKPSTTLTHRIIKKIMISGKVPGFITKGDANRLPDIPIVAGAVEGEVTWHIPNLGYWMLTIKKPIIVLPIVYIAALLICGEETQRLGAYYKSRLPYRVRGYTPVQFPKRSYRNAYMAVSIVFASLSLLSYFGPEALAQLKSNTVSLTANKISTTVVKTAQCSGSTDNNTSISVTSTNSQSATTGSVHSSGGSASSGSASNNSTTNVDINVTNC